MKPKNISDFVSLSEISNNNSDLLLKSTKMNLDKNSYESSIWKFSQNQWRELKQSSYWNFSAPKYSNNKKSFAFIKTPKSTEILDKLEKKKKLEKNKLIFRNRGKEKIVFETDDSIVNYLWSSNDEFIYVITKEWSSEYKKIENKTDHPLEIDKLPFRFDTTGVIYNKRFHIYKVKTSTGKSQKIIDGDKELFLSISSLLEIDSDMYFIASKHNQDGTMLEDQIIKFSDSQLTVINTGGMWSQLFSYQDNLYGVGLDKRFDWPTNISIFKINKRGIANKVSNFIDRGVVKTKVSDNKVYVLYEDSGKQSLLKTDFENFEILYDKELLTSDFCVDGEDIYALVSSFDKKDEVYLIRNDEDKKFSDFNNNFHNKVSTHNCVYERFETGKSQIDTWGILVDINKPTLLNIHGGPASQYGFGFFDEFQVFASSGFNVVACNPRGSSGRGHKFVRDVCGNKWGENDTYDVIKSFEMMIKKLGIKNKNYGIMGGSYGGFMTSWVISHYPKMFKSAVVERALLNWETMVGTSDIGIGFPEMYLLDDLKSNLNLYRKKSPITYANNIITPTLIIHSEKDYRCPIEQAEQLFSNLKRRGVSSSMIRFPDESHELSRSGKPEHRVQRFDSIINWHKKQLS